MPLGSFNWSSNPSLNSIISQDDLITFNFSLFGEENTIEILSRIKQNLNPNGYILIQTIHPENPFISPGSDSNWMQEEWSGFSEDLAPFNWFFRRFEEWEQVFEKCGLKMEAAKTVILPKNEMPFSVIFQLKIP